MSKIKIAIAGIGNCTSSLVQGLEYYQNEKKTPIGLMHEEIQGYSISDIEIVAAFDCDKRKAGKDLSEAIFLDPTVLTHKILAPVQIYGTKLVYTKPFLT